MNNTRFYVNNRIYIKKYMGSNLFADKNKIYTIVHIPDSMVTNKFTSCYEKYCFLDNGTEQLLFSYNYYTKHCEYYVENIPWYYELFCCCFY